MQKPNSPANFDHGEPANGSTVTFDLGQHEITNLEEYNQASAGRGDPRRSEGPASDKPCPRMKEAKDASEGRDLIQEYTEAFASIEKAAGVPHSVGKDARGYGSVGYSTLKPKEKKAAVKRVSEKNPELGKKLQALIEDIDKAQTHWERL
jgi:hypothetical protein